MRDLTFDEQDLLRYVPSESGSTVIRRKNISSAVEKFCNLCSPSPTTPLTPFLETLARGFLSALIYEFITDNDIYRSLRYGSSTSLTECGHSMDVKKVRTLLQRDGDEQKKTHQQKKLHTLSGLGVTIWEVGKIKVLTTILEDVVNLVLDEKFADVVHLKNLEQLAPQTRESVKQKSSVKKQVSKIFSDSASINRLKKRAPLVIYRLFTYLRPNLKTWLKAWNQFLVSPWRERSDVQKILVHTALGIKLADNDIEPFVKAVSKMEWVRLHISQHIFLGKAAQTENRLVDLLVEKLEAAPSRSPEATHFMNGLVIAATVNPYAVEQYLDAMDNVTMNHLPPEFVFLDNYLVTVSEDSLSLLLSEATSIKDDRKNRSPDKRRLAARILLEKFTALDSAARSYLIDLLEKGTDKRQIVLVIEFFLSNERLFADDKTDREAVIDRLLTIAADPISILNKVLMVDFLVTDLRGLAVKMAVKLALSARESVQIDLLIRILTQLICNDNELERVIRMADESSMSHETYESKLFHFINEIFGENNDDLRYVTEWLVNIPLWNEKQEQIGFMFYLYLTESIMRGQLVCLDTMINDPWHKNQMSELYPPVARVFLKVRNNNKEFLDKLWSHSYWQHFERSRGLLSFTLDQLKNVNTLQSSTEHLDLTSTSTEDNSTLEPNVPKLTVSTVDYCLKYLTMDLSDWPEDIEEPVLANDSDTWVTSYEVKDLLYKPPLPSGIVTIEFMLSRLYPRPQTIAWLERIRYGGDSRKVGIYRINIFTCMSVLRSPLIAEEHLDRILGATLSWLEVATRSDMLLTLLELRSCDHRLYLLNHLSQLLIDRSHIVAGTALFVIGEIVKACGDELLPDSKEQLIASIQKHCTSLRLRNFMEFGGVRVGISRRLPASTIRTTANSVLSHLI